MAPLDDNSVSTEGTSFCMGSWIFIADRSGGFESRPIDQATLTTKLHWPTRRSRILSSQQQNPNPTRIRRGQNQNTLELEEDLERLLEDTKQETPMDEKVLSSDCIHFAESSLRKKTSKTSFKKTTRKKKPSENIFSNIDNIDEKSEHCLQLAKDTFNNKTSYIESSNPWALSPTELEQDQAFIKYLEEHNKPISEDELAEWSKDIDLFMEGLTNPNKLETLWEQSKVKRLWDESQNKSSTQLNS